MDGKDNKNLAGQSFGRWNVQADYKYNNGRRMWLCVCSCEAKTKRYVIESNLKAGKSKSCGCLSQEEAKKRGHDLTGRQFGLLLVESRAENKCGRLAWNCVCECGVHKIVTSHDLMSGHTKSCGAKSHRVGQRIMDLTGKEFWNLKVLYPTERRDYKGSVLWHCRCACGRELEASEDSLVHGAQKSCGCLKVEHGKKLQSYLHFYGGTCLEFLEKRKMRSDNKSGVVGVTETVNHKYIANIGFMGKRYRLGRYDDFEMAVEARKKAEIQLHGAFIEAYLCWSYQKEENPDTEDFSFFVERLEDRFVIRSNSKMGITPGNMTGQRLAR